MPADMPIEGSGVPRLISCGTTRLRPNRFNRKCGRLETVSFRGPKKESGRSKARQSVRSQNFEFLALDFDALRQSQRVFDVDAKISNRILNLGVTEQNLHGTQIPSGLVNDRRLRSA